MTIHGQAITTLEEGQAYLRDLVRGRVVFHLEDDPAEVVRRDGSPLFHSSAVPLIRQRVAELYAIEDWGEHDCPIGYLLMFEGQYLDTSLDSLDETLRTLFEEVLKDRWEQTLCSELERYCEVHGLPQECAEEITCHIYDGPDFRDENESLTQEARAHVEYLNDFMQRWGMAQELENSVNTIMKDYGGQS